MPQTCKEVLLEFLKQIGLALHNYHSSFNIFPQSRVSTRWGGGNWGGFNSLAENNCFGAISGNGDAYSWRVMILPFVEQENLYNTINLKEWWYCSPFTGTKSWSTAAGTALPVYLCPSDPTDAIKPRQGHYAADTSAGPAAGTNYAGVQTVVGYPLPFTRAGYFANGVAMDGDHTYPDGGLNIAGNRIRDYVDGTSNTVMVSEVFRGKQSWNTFGNPLFQGDPPLGYTATAQYINPNLRCFMWIEESSTCGIDGVRRPNDPRPDEMRWMDDISYGYSGRRPASSVHAGGVLATLGDGSVRFVSENVNLTVWRNSLSYAGGETNNLTE